jgi:hypothetical protein
MLALRIGLPESVRSAPDLSLSQTAKEAPRFTAIDGVRPIPLALPGALEEVGLILAIWNFNPGLLAI